MTVLLSKVAIMSKFGFTPLDDKSSQLLIVARIVDVTPLGLKPKTLRTGIEVTNPLQP